MINRFLIFLLFANLSCISQNQLLDSLFKLLKHDKLDTTKLIHLNKIAKEFDNNNAYDSAIFYAKQSLKMNDLVIATGTYKKSVDAVLKLKALAYNNLGNPLYHQSNYKEALENHIKALAIRKQINDKKGLSSSYNNMALVYVAFGNCDVALKYFFESLKIEKELNNQTSIATRYNNIGLAYESTGNYPDALKAYLEALKVSELLGEQSDIAMAYNMIGGIYFSQHNFSEALKNINKSIDIYMKIEDPSGLTGAYNNLAGIYFYQKKYQEAIDLHNEVLKISEQLGRKSTQAKSHHNIALVYYELHQYPEALLSSLKSLKINEEIGEVSSIVSSYGINGDIYMKQKQFALARTCFEKVKTMAREIGDIISLKSGFHSLAVLDSLQGDYKSAFIDYKFYVLYRDSIDNEETRKQTIQSQMTYDFEKKEAITKAEHKKELETQSILSEEKSKKQKIILASVVLGLLFALVFAGYVFRSLRISNKQKQFIEVQKKEVEHQKHLVEESQKEIIDSITYAKRIQQAILPSHQEIEKLLPNSFVFYKPKDIVAGDFYWLEHKKDIVFIAAADSTGHGVPGAMVSVVCSNALNRAVNEFDLIDTGKILDKTRELVLETFAKSGEEIKDGMDISLLSINKTTRKINWSGANNPLWYVLNNQLVEIKPDKQPIGKTDNPLPFTRHEIELAENSIFYLLTDGFADQFGGPKGKKFKYKQLSDLLISVHQQPLTQQAQILQSTFQIWKDNLEQVDDVTIIGIKI